MKFKSLGFFLPILINFIVLVGLLTSNFSLAFQVNYIIASFIALTLLLSLCLKLSNKLVLPQVVFVPGALPTAFLILFYLSNITYRLYASFSGLSLYAINNIGSIAQDSTFLSRISSYMVPEAVFIVLYSLVFQYIIASFGKNNYIISLLHQRILRVLFVVLLISRLLSGSIGSIITVLIISIFIFSISYPNVTIFTVLKRSLHNVTHFVDRGILKKKTYILVTVSTCLLLSCSFLSLNRAGSYFYLFSLPFNYLMLVFQYSADIFDFFQTATPANCGLQSNFLLYIFSLKPLVACLSDFRFALLDFGNVQKGSWTGLLGAHAIDYGSSIAILSIAITGVVYIIPLVITMLLPAFASIRLMALFIGSIFYLLSASSIFVEFIAANLIIYLLMLIFASLCFYLKFIRILKLPSL